MFEKELKSFAIGIRYRPNFQITDEFGRIIEEILHAKKTEFDSIFFPQVSRDTQNQFMLHNYDPVSKMMTNKLVINDHDIILECLLDSSAKMKSLRSSFEKKIIKDVMDKLNINGIQRIGYIYQYTFTDEEFNKKFIEQTLSGTQKNMNDFSMRFSKMIPLDKKDQSKEEYNFNNVIYTINKKKNQNIDIAVDYQLHYNLPLTNFSQISFQKFYSTVDNYIKNDFSNWIKEFVN